MMTSLVATWTLTSSPLSLGGGPRLTASGGEAGASLPWTLRAAGTTLALEVGPIDARTQDVRDALGLFHRLTDSLANQLPAGAIVALTRGARLHLPSDVDENALEAIARIAAPVLAPWVHQADARGLTLARGAQRGELCLEFDRMPVPETFDALVLACAALVRAVAREVLWDGASPGDAGSCERTARGFAVGAAPVTAATTQRWRRYAGAVAAALPRQAFDSVSHWLGLADEQPEMPARSHEASSALPAGNTGDALRILPFKSGGRPIDELEEPGTGSSEPCAFVHSGQVPGAALDDLWLLYRLDGLGDVAPDRISVRASAWFLPHEGEQGAPIPVPRLQNVPVAPERVGAFGADGATLEDATFDPKAAASFVARFEPQRQFFPSGGAESWTWADAPEALRERVPDGRDPYTLGCLFHQRVLIELSVHVDGRLVGRAGREVKIYDLERFGSLYGRLLDLVTKDTAAQATRLGAPEIYPAHHPWYPVLGIGMNKANFYMKAVVEDARRQTRHLGNPWWLLDVGLYLELLTCIGVFETVRDEYPDLLTAAERRLLLESPRFAEIRTRINPKRWASVWALRDITPRGMSPLAAGPVGFLNLMKKQKGTLEFLHAHHEDLVHAVELAGTDLVSSQQAWHRVYRDAERAVTNSSLAAFPELASVPAAYRDFALWHEKGDFSRLPGGGLLPAAITGALGDQDGVYPSAARQYRDSMNHVAQVCREKGLMDYAGDECVPVEVSLIESLLSKDEERFRLLQARDGYGGALTATSRTVELRNLPGRRTVLELLRVLPLFERLEPAELEALADGARVVECVPTQEAVTQGAAGDSMFVVESGRVQVESGGRVIRTLVPGEVFGEMALLTGAPRAATVRAIDYGTLVELTKEALQPIVERRTSILDGMSELLAARQLELRANATDTRTDLGNRMRRHLVRHEGAAPASPGVHELDELLGRVPLFTPLTAAERTQLAARASARTYRSGEAIVRQGERGRSLFAVYEGCVVVRRKDGGTRKELATLGRGAIFGELGLLTGERRSADVEASADTVIVEISRSDFLPLMTRRPPLVVELSDMLEQRRAADAQPLSLVPGASLARRIRDHFFS